jgi:hypothetical protein
VILFIFTKRAQHVELAECKPKGNQKNDITYRSKGKAERAKKTVRWRDMSLTGVVKLARNAKLTITRLHIVLALRLLGSLWKDAFSGKCRWVLQRNWNGGSTVATDFTLVRGHAASGIVHMVGS